MPRLSLGHRPHGFEDVNMDGWQFGPARELRRAFIFDETNQGPIYRHRAGKSAAVLVSAEHVFLGTCKETY